MVYYRQAFLDTVHHYYDVIGQHRLMTNNLMTKHRDVVDETHKDAIMITNQVCKITQGNVTREAHIVNPATH